jgi:hypothetical protein
MHFFLNVFGGFFWFGGDDDVWNAGIFSTQ